MYRIGIDLGGTNIAVGVVDSGYHLISEASVPAGAGRPAEQVVADMCRAVELALDKAGLTARDCASIGVGAPGTCDPQRGVVVCAYNLGWFDVPVCRMLTEHFGLPARLSNDANCAALAETVAGAAVGCRNMVLITLGTGVGGGIIVDGQIVSGLGGAGGEVGHSLLVLDGQPCTCGRSGCWEAYASATALIRQGKEAAASHPDSLLNRYPALTGRDVFDAADDGDAAAKAVLDRYYDYVAAGITNLVNILSPEMVLIGGGISRQGERLLAPIRRYVAANCFGGTERPQPVIQAAQLGNEAGQPHAVTADKASGVLVDAPVLGTGEPLVIEGAVSRVHAKQLGLLRVQHHRLIALVGGEGHDAHMVQEAVKAVGLQHVPCQMGIDVLGIVAGLQDQRLAVHVAHAGETVRRRALPQLHLLAHGLIGHDHVEVDQRRGRHLAQRGHLGGEGVPHAPAVGGGVGHEGAAAALADHQSLVLQLADGLPHGVAADVHPAAQLRLAGQQIAHGQRTGGNIAFDDAHQLGIQGNIAVHGQLGVQDRILFHCKGFLSLSSELYLLYHTNPRKDRHISDKYRGIPVFAENHRYRRRKFHQKNRNSAVPVGRRCFRNKKEGKPF